MSLPKALLPVACCWLLVACLLLSTSCTTSATPSPTSDPALAGLRLLIASDRGITEVADGRERLLIGIEPGSYALDPIVSRDGARLAYVLQTPAVILPDGNVDFGSDLYVAERDGASPRLVLKHRVVAEFIRTPAWLPDGTLLITVRGRDAATGNFDFHIATLDPDRGTTRRFLDDAIDPVLSPDGRSLLYLEIDPDSQEERLVLSLLDRSTAPIPLAGTYTDLVLISSAVWSPDGTTIAFAATDVVVTTPGPDLPGVQPHPFAQDVWLVDADGGNLRRLTELADNQPSIDWSPDGRSIYALGATGFWRIDAATGSREQIGYAAPLGQIRTLP